MEFKGKGQRRKELKKFVRWRRFGAVTWMEWVKHFEISRSDLGILCALHL